MNFSGECRKLAIDIISEFVWVTKVFEDLQISLCVGLINKSIMYLF